ncbi:response regulator [Acidisoma cladoniae]|uniref:response regulator n=1 Tax=Acidisoma cladoniae TaxID=3040935 RepID=UPI00254FAFEA|nr:response regulator transcription factor [Acidisoma sp. PAMC 29798]
MPDSVRSEPTCILVVEDDDDIRALILRYLTRSGYVVVGVADGSGLDREMARQPFDLILLDVMLPAETGFELCRRIHTISQARIIMVTALAEVTDRVAGLELGADDYVGKPFELVELGARIKAVLRRGVPRELTPQANAAAAGLHFAGWRFEPERRVLYTSGDVRMTLTGAETDLMLVFYHHPGRVLSREELIALTRGASFIVEERTIDLLISRLRRKLAHGGRQLELIRTIRGDGYVFDPTFGGTEKLVP